MLLLWCAWLPLPLCLILALPLCLPLHVPALLSSLAACLAVRLLLVPSSYVALCVSHLQSRMPSLLLPVLTCHNRL